MQEIHWPTLNMFDESSGLRMVDLSHLFRSLQILDVIDPDVWYALSALHAGFILHFTPGCEQKVLLCLKIFSFIHNYRSLKQKQVLNFLHDSETDFSC